MAAAETLPEIGLGDEFSGDLDAMDDMLADEDATLTNQSAVEGVQVNIWCRLFSSASYGNLQRFTKCLNIYTT